MCKVAAMVNEELSHITTTLYSATTVHIYQLICLIGPSSYHCGQSSWSTVAARELIPEERL